MNVTTPAFTTFPAVERHLEGLGLFRMTPGLGRMRSMLARLNLTRPPFWMVQVVGTNGKGSTSTMLASLARSYGLRAGLHTSPHFVSVRERIRLGDRLLDEQSWLHAANLLMANGGEELSYFEFVTMVAVVAFAGLGPDAMVDVAIMETGLGGRFDATSALDADAVVFTPIALDHQALLGSTLEAIATDKAGAIRERKPVVSAPQKDVVRTVLTLAATERKACLYEVADTYPLPHLTKGMTPRLQGAHQEANARLALASWHLFMREWMPGGMLLSPVTMPSGPKCILSGCGTLDGSESSAKAESGQNAESDAQGICNAWIPGRLQALAPAPARPGAFSPGPYGWPPMLLDGAHNVHGLSALGTALGKAGIAPLAIIFSCLADKDLPAIIPLLRSLATGKIFVPPVTDNPRAMEPGELARMIGLNAEPVESIKDAVLKAVEHMHERMPEVFAGDCAHPLLVCGSLYMLGDFYTLRPEALEPQ